MVNKNLRAIASSEETKLTLGEVELDCYVLDNGVRVISGRGMQKSLGFSPSASGSSLAKLVDSRLASYMSDAALDLSLIHI